MTENFGVPWETAYGYVQAIKSGDTIYLSGQLSHKGAELVAPAIQFGNAHPLSRFASCIA